jgi:N-acyl-phosphatidylethanolamine-hydrolysing phospholipase D
MRANQRYTNPHVKDTKRTLLDVIRWKMGYFGDRVPEHPAPQDFSFPLPEHTFDERAPSVTWINHSTFLIEIDGLHILTDPIWSQRCSPLPFLGPKRRHLPPVKLEELPKIDLVLISHDHYDHLDKKTVRALHRLNPNTLWLVPRGVKSWFERAKIYAVHECSWWDEVELAFGQIQLRATAVPAQHFSGRSASALNSTLWAGWVVEFTRASGAQKNLYFVGDTGYNPYDFKEIGQRWPSIDLSLIPIGCYLPRAFMAPVHVEPQDAVRIHCDVNSKLSLGMHWKTFHLSDEPMHQPPYDLLRALQAQKIDSATFLAIKPGYALNW